MTFDIDVAVNTRDIVRRIQALEAAKTAVRPYVGDAAMACDSIGDVWVTAIKQLGHKADGLVGEPEAAKAIFDVLKRYPAKRTLAQDAKSTAARDAMFPHWNRLRHG